MPHLPSCFFLWCLFFAAGADAASVRFQVDMERFLAAGYLDPTTDVVEVRGDFNGWAAGQHPLQADPGGATYSVALELPAGGVAYKFLIVRSGGAEVWEEDVSNRIWQVPADGGNAPTVFFNDLGAPYDPAARRVGSDLSFAPQLESLGAAFGRDGQAEPLLALVERAGLDLVRLRLWHTPIEPWHGLDAVLAHALQLQAAGFDLMLDLHYSDTWADPGHQTPPAAWQGVPAAAIADSVAAYTTHVLERFVGAGVVPRYVQLGNEIDAGLLWDAGRVGWPGSVWDTVQQWSVLTGLLQAASSAARAALPVGADTELIVHLSPGGDNTRCRWFLDELATASLDYDAIGLSYYPWWHGTLWDLKSNLRDLGPRYGKPVLVVETAYPWTLEAADAIGNFVTDPGQLTAGYPATPRGQRDFLRDVLRVVETSGGVGVVYWAPDFIPVSGGPGNPYENLTLFDFDGQALPGLDFGAPATVSTSTAPRGPNRLLQNQPNPFNPSTVIRYRLERAGPVSLKVYDLAGRLVSTLADSTVAEGWHQAQWFGRDDRGRRVSSGLYLYELVTPEGSQRRRMVLAR